MENKYYTPKLEELFVGYECERWDSHELENEGWVLSPYRICANDIVGSEDSTWLKNILRTPFLTKEQIEGEGFGAGHGLAEFSRTAPIVHVGRIKEGVVTEIQYDLDTHLLKVFRDHFIFEGKCPSINEFRTIIKLLGI